jgi:hypothetical protein
MPTEQEPLVALVRICRKLHCSITNNVFPLGRAQGLVCRELNILIMKPSVEKRKKRTFAAISEDGQRSLQSIPGQKRTRVATIHGVPLFIESTPSSIKPTRLSNLTVDLKMAADEKHPISPLFLLSSDMMAGILTFLEPVEVLKALTSPLCKDWCEYYTYNRDLWKVLCFSEPFNLENRILLSSSDDDSSSSSSLKGQPTEDDKLGRHRLMYTSFIRCIRYLKQIKEGCQNGNDSQQSPVGVGRDSVARRSRTSNNPIGDLAIDTKKPKVRVWYMFLL